MFVLPLSFRISGTRPQYSVRYFSARPMPRDGRETASIGQFELIAWVGSWRVGEEIGGAVLQPLVQWQYQQAAIARAEAV